MTVRVLARDRIPEILQRADLPAPVRQRLDPEVEVHALPEERLDLLPRPRSQALDARTASPDQDLLLTLPLDVDRRTDVDRVRRLTVFLDTHRGRVRHLLLVLLEDRLADQLRHEEPDGLHRQLVFRIEKRTDGEACLQRAEELGDTLPRRSRQPMRLQPELRPAPCFECGDVLLDRKSTRLNSS